MSIGLGRSHHHYIRCLVCGRFFLPVVVEPGRDDSYCTRKLCQRMKAKQMALLNPLPPLVVHRQPVLR
jgi:hypothetical protein